MNTNQRMLDRAKKQAATVILQGMSFAGDIKGSHDLFLDGEVEGTIDLTELLFIGRSGKLTGDVNAKNVIIEGEAEGTLTAKNRIVLHDGSKCKGDIIAPSVMISDRAFFQGHVKMGEAGREVEPLIFTEKREEMVINNPRQANSDNFRADGRFSQADNNAEKDSFKNQPKIVVVDDMEKMNLKTEANIDKFK